MPVVKGLPERPKIKAKEYNIHDFNLDPFTFYNYLKNLEKYCDALENWIDIRAFQDGDDEHQELKGTAEFKMSIEKDAIPMLIKALLIANEEEVKKVILEKYPHGVGLIE